MKLHLPTALLSALMALCALSHADHATYLPGDVSVTKGVYNIDASRFVDMGKGFHSWGYNQVPYENGKALFRGDNAGSAWDGYDGSYEYLGELQKRLVADSFGYFYDPNVAFKDMRDDESLCWGYAAANQIQYWQSYYGVFYKGDKKLTHGYTYDKQYHNTLGGGQSLNLGMLFYDSWGNKSRGGALAAGLAWYMDGNGTLNPYYGEDSLYTGSQLVAGADPGGYFKGYFGDKTSYVTYAPSASLDDLASKLATLLGYEKDGQSYTKLADGHLASMALQNGGDRGHALTICGFEVGTDELILKIADSDDGAYGIYNLHVTVKNKKLMVSYDDGTSYNDFYITDIAGIRVSETLVAMRAAYDAANERGDKLVWLGGKSWDAKTYDEADKLPSAESPWAVYVNAGNAGYYSSFYQEGRDIAFNDTASDSSVTLEGDVTAGSMSINNSAKAYDFSGNYTITAESLTKEGSQSARFTDTDLVVSGTVSVKGGTVTLAGSSSLGSTGAVTISGGTMSLENTAAPTSGYNLSADSVSISGTGALDMSESAVVMAGSVTIGESASVTLTGTSSLTAEGNVNVSDTGSLSLSDSASMTATTLSVSGGSVSFGNTSQTTLNSMVITGGAVALTGNAVVNVDTMEHNGGTLDVEGSAFLNVKQAMDIKNEAGVVAYTFSNKGGSSESPATILLAEFGADEKGGYIKGSVEKNGSKAQLLNSLITVTEQTRFTLEDASLSQSRSVAIRGDGNGVATLAVKNVDVSMRVRADSSTESYFVVGSDVNLSAGDQLMRVQVVGGEQSVASAGHAIEHLATTSPVSLDRDATVFAVSSSLLSDLVVTGDSLTLDFRLVGTPSPWDGSYDFLAVTFDGTSFDFSEGLVLTATIGGKTLSEVYYAESPVSTFAALGAAPTTTLYFAATDVPMQMLGVPEPTTATLSLLALAALAARRRRKHNT